MRAEEPVLRATRLNYIQNLLYGNRHGLSSAELARSCGVSVRTIQRDIACLGVPPYNVPLLPRGRRWFLDGPYQPPLSALRLTLPEATALFLAARLLGRTSDENNPFVTAALAKLAAVLPERMAEHVRATLIEEGGPAVDDLYVRAFDVMTSAWATSRKVRFSYQAATSAHIHTYILSPYFIEPSAPSYAAYIIGYEETYFRAVRTFKLERVRAAELTDDRFSMPTEFDITEFLSSAWGIMGGEGTVEVRLLFAPQARRRVKESLWHRSQAVLDTPDGGCELRVRVNRPLEMISWVLGWGGKVEVLAPEELRQRVAEEAGKMAREYGSSEANGRRRYDDA